MEKTSKTTKEPKDAKTAQGESKRKSSSTARKARRTPQQQLLSLLQTDFQKAILLDNIAPMKESYSDDFCIACIAYIRYGIKFSFANKTMQILFLSYVDLLDEKLSVKY